MTVHRQLQALRGQIEQQLNWGESTNWSNYDFEKLSEQIRQKTGVSLSVSTLKRVLGKVIYSSEPSLTTLNALAQFLDFIDWRAFGLAQTEDAIAEPIKTKPASSLVVTHSMPSRRYWPLGLAGIVLVCLFLFFRLADRQTQITYKPDDFQFRSSTMLTQGLPNSVVFDFNASKASTQDSVFICQNWDTRRKAFVNKNDKHHSAIYYYPGYFRAKLMIGSQVVKEHDIQINTKGWLGMVEADWGVEPLYFKPSEIWASGSVRITKALLDKYRLPLTPLPPTVLLYNQQEIRGITTDNFTFQTQLRTEYGEGANTCQRIQVLLQAKEDIMIVPIVQEGCVGDIFVAAYGHYASGNRADLSGFGCQPNQWTTLKVECKQRSLTFYLNGKAVYKAQMTHKPTEIVGVQYRFNGPGAIQNTWLSGATGRIAF